MIAFDQSEDGIYCVNWVLKNFCYPSACRDVSSLLQELLILRELGAQKLLLPKCVSCDVSSCDVSSLLLEAAYTTRPHAAKCSPGDSLLLDVRTRYRCKPWMYVRGTDVNPGCTYEV